MTGSEALCTTALGPLHGPAGRPYTPAVPDGNDLLSDPDKSSQLDESSPGRQNIVRIVGLVQ